MNHRGKEFHGEISDGASGSAFALYRNNGSGSAWTLSAAERVVITDFTVSTDDAGVVTIGCDGDAAGERLFQGQMAANETITASLATPHYCKQGETPTLVNTGGAQDGNYAQIKGFILDT